MSYNIKDCQADFKKIEEWLNTEYKQVHSGRATPMILDGIVVDNYGSMVPLRNVASISIEDPKTLRIAPWDKNTVKAIEKSLIDSNLGLGVVSDSDGVRLTFPPLTTERRTETVKILKTILEDARIRVRKIRESELKKIDEITKNDGIGEDDKRRLEQDMQKTVDQTNANLESIFKQKEKEVLGDS